MTLRYGLLGPLAVTGTDGRTVDLGGRQPRTMLAALLVASPHPVAADALIDAVWGEDPPASAPGTLQSYVSRLRRRLGPGSIRHEEAAYRLDVAPEAVDHRRFEDLADAGRRHLDDGDPAAARGVLIEADALWRGPALAELADLDFAAGFAARLEERRLAALEDRLDADLALGHHAAIVGQLTELVAAHPLRERMQGQLALALYRSGRQADALRALAEAGRTLRDQLGIEPSRPLRQLEAAILDHDRALEAPAAGAAPRATDPAAPADRGTGGAADAPALVGRGAELETLLAALDESAGDGRMVVVEGEPGIGKTRLVDEVRARAGPRGALAVWGRSDEGGAAPALWPWLVPLRAVTALVADVPTAVADLLDGENPLPAGQAQNVQFERFEAVADLLGRVARSTPLVIALDDLQWADAASLELLGFLAGRLDPGVLVVGTVRVLEVGRNDAVTEALAAVARRPGSRRLRLRGLTPEATAEVLSTTTNRELAAPVAAAIHDRADGNPFYAIELSRLLDEHGALVGEVPGSIGDVIRRRLANLPGASVDLLGAAAVVGRDVELRLLAGAAGRPLDEVLDDLEPAVVHRLLVEVSERPDQLRFSHALVREVLLDDLTSLRRARMHLRVADAMEAAGAGADEAEVLAEHLWRAAPVGVGTRAAEALERAAEVAMRRVSYGTAEDLLGRAVQLRRAASTSGAGQDAELQALYRLLEVARARRYFQGADLDLVDRAKDLARRRGRTDLLQFILWFEFASRSTAARVQAAVPLAEAHAAMTLDDPDPDVRASGHMVLAVSRWGRGQISEMVECADRGVALLEGTSPAEGSAFATEQRLLAYAFWLLAHALRGDMPADQIFGHFDDLLAAMPDRFAAASVCGFACTAAAVLGAWADNERYVAHAEEADPNHQFAFWAGQAHMERGIALAARGEAGAAVTAFERGMEQYTAIGGRSALATYAAVVAMHLAGHATTDDERAAAARLAALARSELDTYGEMWNAPVVSMAEATVAAQAGDVEAAARHLAAATEIATAQGALGQVTRAREVAADLGLPPPG